MRGSFRRALPAFVGLTTAGLIVTLGAGAASALKQKDARPVDKVVHVRLRRHAARPDGEVRQGRLHADVQGADEATARPATTACSRPSRRTPASAGTRWPPARTRPSTARRTTRSSAAGDAFSNRTSFSAAARCSRRTRSRTRPSGPARRSRRSTGSAARPRTSTARPSTSRTSSRTAACSSAPPNAVEQAGSAFFGVTYQVATRSRPRSGWTQRPAGDPAATPKETTWTINSTFAAQNPNRTYNVYFYDSVAGGGVELRPRDREPGRQDGRERRRST